MTDIRNIIGTIMKGANSSNKKKVKKLQNKRLTNEKKSASIFLIKFGQYKVCYALTRKVM